MIQDMNGIKSTDVYEIKNAAFNEESRNYSIWCDSKLQLLNGKRIIVLGGWPYRLRNIIENLATYGIKVILVDSDPKHIARELVHSFIQYDFSEHIWDREHASEIVNMILDMREIPDGCISFFDECIPLSALLNESLELRGPRYKSAVTANSKAETLNILGIQNAIHLKDESDCGVLQKRFPAILKLDSGAGGIGACMITSQADLKKRFQEITRSLRTDSDYPGIGLSHSNSMTLMEFYNGTEHNVDVILYDKKLVWAFVSDSGLVRKHSFLATAKRMPSMLSEEQKTQIIDAALKCCIDIGLTDGLFNVEFMVTSNGPKLLEINPRMSGYILRDWLQKLYGIDIMVYSIMVACGIKPEIANLSTDSVLMGVMVLPSLHAKLLTDNRLKRKLAELIENGHVHFVQFQKLTDKVFSYEEPFGNIAVAGKNSNEAKQKLLNVCKELDINKEAYNVETFIQNF